jgi:hypothetical protein
MALRDWLPFCDPDNGLTPKQERDYDRWYEDTIKQLKAGSGGKRAAQEFINEEHRKYVVWRREAKKRENRR